MLPNGTSPVAIRSYRGNYLILLYSFPFMGTPPPIYSPNSLNIRNN